MLRCTSGRFALLAALLLALAVPGQATTVARQSFESLTDRSDLIVRGVVERVELRAGAGESPPFRLAYVRVAETAAGHAPEVVPVRIPGGVTADGRACAVAGAPSLAVGDEIVLFLTRVPAAATARPTVAPPAREHGARGIPAGGAQPSEQWQPIALSLGTWRVVGAPGARRVVADAAAAGLHVAGEQAGRAMPASQPVGELLSRVRERRAGSSP